MALLGDALKAGLGTGISRVMGLGREIALAHFFGATGELDAFFVAFLIPHLLRRLFGEGGLAAAFLPRYVQALKEGEGERFRRASLSFALLFFPAICLLGTALVPLYVPLLAGGFPVERLELAISLSRALFPFIGLVGFAALLTGILNAHGRFFLPSLGPAFLSLGLMAGALASCFFHPPVYGLVVGLLFGGGLQVLSQLLLLRGKLALGWPWHPGFRDIGRRMGPVLFGLFVAELNAMVDNRLASGLPGGSISVLQYGMRLFQFPIGIIAVSVATAILPRLSRHGAHGEWDAFRKELQRGTEILLFLILPATAGLYLIGGPTVHLLFRHGAFSSGAAVETIRVLEGYGVGLWGYGLVYLLSRAFYALGRPFVPALSGALAVATNIVLDIALVGPWGTFGLAIATGIAGALDATVQGVLLWRAIPGWISGTTVLQAFRYGGIVAAATAAATLPCGADHLKVLCGLTAGLGAFALTGWRNLKAGIRGGG